MVPPNFQKLIFSAQGIHLRVPVCDHVRDVDIKTGVHLVCVHVFLFIHIFLTKGSMTIPISTNPPPVAKKIVNILDKYFSL